MNEVDEVYLMRLIIHPLENGANLLFFERMYYQPYQPL